MKPFEQEAISVARQHATLLDLSRIIIVFVMPRNRIQFRCLEVIFTGSFLY